MYSDDGHIPVLIHEVLDTLAPQDNETHIDGTFGGGGYTRRILDAAKCNVIGIDRDPHAVTRGHELEKEYDRFKIVEGCFGDMGELINEPVDGIVLDLGVSSFQIDQAERGFSFQKDGPLDMRMSQDGLSAADIINTYDEKEIADILYKYGEERKSRRIASRIVERRKTQKFETTLDLAELIESTLGKKRKPNDAHPATRSFQALRIAVNDELGELDRALEASIKLLKPNGRLVVVTFHSLEDRRVKTFFREMSGDTPNVSRHVPIAAMPDDENDVYFTCPTRRAIAPSDTETQSNPRARSAKLRYGIRTSRIN